MATPPPSQEPYFWSVTQPQAYAWRSWDGEMVVYDDLSGDTMKLDLLMSETFKQLLRGPATHATLLDHLATTYELEVDLRLQRLVEMVLDRLKDAGLIGLAPAPVHPPQAS